MKKLTLLFLLAFSIAGTAVAQESSPVIKELRSIIADAPNAFQSLVGDVDGEDKESGTTFYKTAKAPEASIAKSFLLHKNKTGHRTYVLNYNVENLDGMNLKIMMMMVKGYVAEMNEMVKSGNYTGRDYQKQDGTTVTEINDLEGNHIMDYQSTKAQQMIIVYCTKKH